MKKVALLAGGLVVVGFILWVLLADEKTLPELEDDQTTETSVETNEEKTPISSVAKTASKNTAPTTPSEADPVFSKQLDDLIETNRKEIEECEIGLDRVLGSSIEDENDQIYREDNLLDTLDEFDRTTLSPKSSGQLLKLLADEKIKTLSPEELGSKLQDLRPCRPYKKMSFIHNLMTKSQKSKWDEETKKRALKTVFNYFKKELGDHTTISNLNMQAALLESMVTEGMLPKKFEDKVSEYKEELEDSYDELLDKADDLREEQEESGDGAGFIPLDIIRSEFEVGEKFRKNFQSMIKEMEGQVL